MLVVFYSRAQSDYQEGRNKTRQDKDQKTYMVWRGTKKEETTKRHEETEETEDA